MGQGTHLTRPYNTCIAKICVYVEGDLCGEFCDVAKYTMFINFRNRQLYTVTVEPRIVIVLLGCLTPAFATVQVSAQRHLSAEVSWPQPESQQCNGCI